MGGDALHTTVTTTCTLVGFQTSAEMMQARTKSRYNVRLETLCRAPGIEARRVVPGGRFANLSVRLVAP
jgi:hypothetical protein